MKPLALVATCITLGILPAVILTGCNDAAKANEICRTHGGVLSTDGYNGLVTCGDHIVRND